MDNGIDAIWELLLYWWIHLSWISAKGEWAQSNHYSLDLKIFTHVVDIVNNELKYIVNYVMRSETFDRWFLVVPQIHHYTLN